MRQQRKGSPIGVADEDLDETRLQDESGLLCGLLDHGSEPVGAERGEHEQVRLDDLGEALVIGQVSETVRADRDDEHAAEDHCDSASKNSRISAGSSAANACSH